MSPYIKQQRRMYLRDGDPPDTPGELNYTITRTILKYLDVLGESYQTYCDILGTLEAIKCELYRRKIATYENKKIKSNGDVF